MNRFLKFASLIVVVVLLLYVLITARVFKDASDDVLDRHARGSRDGFLNLAPDIKYIGDRECTVCHSDISDTFKQTGMGRSFYVPSNDNVIEDYVTNNHVFDPKSNFHYEMIAKDGQFFQIEYRLNEQGIRTHELARQIDYIIGSGNHARTYLFSENGFFYELPITWYTTIKSWDMSPGYRSRNQRFSRPIPERCMSCHNSFSGHTEYSVNRFSDVPHGIGCERCHGPGELDVNKHYAAEDRNSETEEVDRTIVNPKHLDLELQVDVCRQCHLTGSVRILKDGKKGTDFRPGMRLTDIASIYVRDGSSTDDFGVSSHGVRMSLSKCFTNSGGRLLCTTCHNPHEPVQWRSRDSFNQICLACHGLDALSPTSPRSDHTAGGDCVACHMPQGAASDVLHVNFTDHWIRKETQAISTSDTHSSPGSKDRADFVLKDFFEEKDSAAQIRLGIAYLRYFEKHKVARPLVDRAISLLTSGLKIQPRHRNGLYHLGKAFQHSGRLNEALVRFQMVIRVEPGHASGHHQLAKMLHDLGRLDDAAETCEASLNLFSDNVIALSNLGNIHAQLGKPHIAIDCYEQALQVRPWHLPALVGLGTIHESQLQDPQTATMHFQNALDHDPDHFWALHHLGSIHMKSDHYEKAIDCFNRAVEVDPTSVSGHGNLALLHSALGQIEQAVRSLHNVLEIDPDNGRAKELLTQLHASNETAAPDSMQ